LAPGKYASMASDTQIVKVRNSSGKVICIFGGSLW
jgi:hypothetical protein